MKIVFSNRAFASILAETTEKIKTETGGLFLGKCIDDTWYVVEAIDPGPNSIFQVYYFEYDQKYTQHLINKVANLYNTKLELIGLWHRHPGSMDFFSSTDDGTNAKYASMNPKGAISGLVNIDPTFRLTMYQVDRPCRYSVIKYQVGDELFPPELLELKSTQRFMNMMDQMTGRVVPEPEKGISIDAFVKKIAEQLESQRVDTSNCELVADEDAMEVLLDAFFDDITFLSDRLGVSIELKNGQTGIELVHKAPEGNQILYCYKDKESDDLFVEYKDGLYFYSPNMFEDMFNESMECKAEEEDVEETSDEAMDAMIDEAVDTMIDEMIDDAEDSTGKKPKKSNIISFFRKK